MIYFVQRADGAIKIGTTIRFEQGMNQLGREYGSLTLLGVMEGDAEAEYSLHIRFASALLEKREWFKDCEPVREFIRMNTTLEVPSGKRFRNVSVSELVSEALSVIKYIEKFNSSNDVLERLIQQHYPKAMEIADRRIREVEAFVK